MAVSRFASARTKMLLHSFLRKKAKNENTRKATKAFLSSKYTPHYLCEVLQDTYFYYDKLKVLTT